MYQGSVRLVIDYLPHGLVGLLIAVIFIAGWGSIAAALNSLASSTVVDIHKQFTKNTNTPKEEYAISKWYSLAWGVFCIVVAQFAGNMGSLIEAVNVLGSLFYGVILGIFLVAFYCRWVTSNAVFWAAIIVEFGILFLFWYSSLGFLWLTAVGALAMILLSSIIQAVFLPRRNTPR